jgi:hypothetical protein
MAKEPKSYADKLADKIEQAQLGADAWEHPDFRSATKRSTKAKKAQAREIAREDMTEDCQFAIARKLSMAKEIAREVKAHPENLAVLDPASAKAKATESEAKAKAKELAKANKALEAKLAALVTALQTGTVTKKVKAIVAAASCAESAPEASTSTPTPSAESATSQEAGN